MRRLLCTGSRLLLGALLLAPLAGCRDSVDPYQTGDRPGGSGDTVRLTFSVGEDRAPAWLGNDSILYTAAGFDPYPIWPGLLATMTRQGGVATLLFPGIQQAPLPKQFTTPVPSPAGDRVAFVDLNARDSMCSGYAVVYSSEAESGKAVPAPAVPKLISARLVVRARSALGPLTSDPTVSLTFPGVTESGVVLINRFYPFQRAYSLGQAIAFRPSWSPDGQKLVFSDGLRLLVWTVGQPSASPLAGGEGGTSPAWSPRGDQIAFAKPVVNDSSQVTYTYVRPNGSLACSEVRTRYVQLSTRLMLIPAAGGTARDMGDGDEPAWTPDGATLYARDAADQVFSMPATGGARTMLPSLRYANDLAISPDGKWLAYTRAGATGNHDVWVARLSH